MTGPRIALIHATPVSLDPIRLSFQSLWPEAELANLLDDVLAVDRAKDADFTPDIRRRILSLASYAHSLGAEAILFTCSAFGPLIEEADRLLPVPVLKPNEAMFEEALSFGDRIGMISTFAPSVATMEAEFAEEAARLRPTAKLATRLAPGAMETLLAGDAAAHNRMVAQCAEGFDGADVLMLGQFSMARALDAVRACTHLPVLSSPEAAIRKVRRLVTAV